MDDMKKTAPLLLLILLVAAQAPVERVIPNDLKPKAKPITPKSTYVHGLAALTAINSGRGKFMMFS